MIKEEEYKLRIWFLTHELYSDGSNAEEWLKDLKQEIEELFDINLKEVEDESNNIS